jgi:hypothetical protein
MTPVITELGTLLSSMTPVLDRVDYVFVSVPADHPGGLQLSAEALLQFRETEGITFVVPVVEAIKLGVPFEFSCRRISLMVYSSLSAVGFLAVICSELAKAGISVNPVSAYHHDHLFVPAVQADEAMTVLRRIATE